MSVGEAGVAATLIRALPGALPLVVTTITPTGQAVARRSLGAERVAYLPFDLGFSVRRFLDAFTPNALVLVEGDLWPLLLARVKRRGLPVVVVNGRVSDRGFARLRRLGRAGAADPPPGRPLRGPDRARPRAPDRPRRAGRPGPGHRQPQVRERRAAAPCRRSRPRCAGSPRGRPILVAGSTMDGEEPAVLDAFDAVGPRRRAAPGRARCWSLAPRHPERDRRGARPDRGARLERRATAASCRSARRRIDVLLLDTMGELASLYRLAAGVFIGGTLVPTGGHNPLEAARFGAPIAVGPSMHNFAEMADGFDARGGVAPRRRRPRARRGVERVARRRRGRARARRAGRLAARREPRRARAHARSPARRHARARSATTGRAVPMSGDRAPARLVLPPPPSATSAVDPALGRAARAPAPARRGDRAATARTGDLDRQPASSAAAARRRWWPRSRRISRAREARRHPLAWLRPLVARRARRLARPRRARDRGRSGRRAAAARRVAAGGRGGGGRGPLRGGTPRARGRRSATRCLRARRRVLAREPGARSRSARVSLGSSLGQRPPAALRHAARAARRRARGAGGDPHRRRAAARERGALPLAAALVPFGFTGPAFAADRRASIAAPDRMASRRLAARRARHRHRSSRARRGHRARAGLEVLEHLVFPDHHPFPQRSLDRIERAFANDGCDRRGGHRQGSGQDRRKGRGAALRAAHRGRARAGVLELSRPLVDRALGSATARRRRSRTTGRRPRPTDRA